MRIGKRLIFLVVLALLLTVFVVNPTAFATRVHAWFNYMGDNVKEAVDLASRRLTLLTGGPCGYALTYTCPSPSGYGYRPDPSELVEKDMALKLTEMVAQFTGEYYIKGAAHKRGMERIGWVILLYAILLPIGAVRMYRSRRLNCLRGADFNNIPGDKSERWRRYAFKSVNSFFWATWGTFIISVIIGVVIAPFFIRPGSPRIFLFVLFLSIMIWLLLGLIDSLIYGIKAANLKKSLREDKL